MFGEKELTLLVQNIKNLFATHAGDANVHISSAERAKLNSIASGAEANVQSDWNVTDSTSDAFIKNKPGIVSTTANGFAPKVTSTSGFLKGDGTWATPTNTTYTFATGDANGQIKITPAGGTAQNVSVKGLGSLAYSSATIPTITDTYSATSANGMSGKAVASALGSYIKSTDVESSNIDFSTYFTT